MRATTFGAKLDSAVFSRKAGAALLVLMEDHLNVMIG
jgi:hypothetical protein